jgi:hypothetical protein
MEEDIKSNSPSHFLSLFQKGGFMNHNTLSTQESALADIVSLIKRSQNTGLDRDPRCNKLLFWLQAIPDDAEIRQTLEESLQQAEFKNLTDPNPFRAKNPRSLNNLSGNLILGAIREVNIPYLIPVDLLTSHFLIFGRTGGGKTNLILLILAQILQRNKNA